MCYNFTGTLATPIIGADSSISEIRMMSSLEGRFESTPGDGLVQSRG